MSELKPCPFCGNQAFVTGGIRGSECIFYIRCGDCEAIGEKFGSKWDYEAKENAIKSWNTRYTDNISRDEFYAMQENKE